VGGIRVALAGLNSRRSFEEDKEEEDELDPAVGGVTTWGALAVPPGCGVGNGPRNVTDHDRSIVI
jgi:hypothetical protein